MNLHLFRWLMIIIFIIVVHAENRIFKLPRLILHADQYFLMKQKAVDLSCQIEPGWRGATMADVHWIKDGVPISEVKSLVSSEIHVNGPTLRIQNGRHHAEGDYQCSAVVRGVRISNGQHIDTRLVSAPVKFRRARITKFEKVSDEQVTVVQGQVARLPCSGMPDVIPGPPEITFIKDGDDRILGLPGDERYLATSSGLQISIIKITDTGNYYCLVRNTFTNQTRKSFHFVRLEVLVKQFSNTEPVLVFPKSQTSISQPIVIDAVKGQAVLLECIITLAKIVWSRADSVNTEISLSNEQARFRQVWGNLRIRQITEADTGIYVCESSTLLSQGVVDAHPKVYYDLRVHAPTDVQLMLGQLAVDKSWKLSCLALNLHYEIPMVYINGLALIDAMDQLGVPPHTNFFTNPINATLTSTIALSGSVQCISRPAMDEAEVYGNGLERGRAMNLYVDNRANKEINLILQGPDNSTKLVGETVQLVCLVVPRTTKTIWIKDGKRMALIGKERVRLVGTASLQISDVQLEDEGWYTCEVTDNTNQITRSSAYLKIQSHQHVPEDNVLSQVSPNHLGIMDERVAESMSDKDDDDYDDKKINTTQISLFAGPPRAFISGTNVRLQWTLMKDYLDFNQLGFFQIEFRVESDEKKWILGDQVDSHVRAVTVKALIEGNKYQFRVAAKTRDNDIIIISPPTKWLELGVYKSKVEIRANDAVNSTLLEQLEPDTEYKLVVVVEQNGKVVASSEPLYARTLVTGIGFANPVTNGSLGLSVIGRQFYQSISNWGPYGIVAVLVAIFLSPIICIMFGLFLFHLKHRHTKRIANEANGKFMDTSHRIFNEQRVQKSHLYYDPATVISGMEDEEEYTLLRTKQNGNHVSQCSLLTNFPFPKNKIAMPNFYGDEEEKPKQSTSFKRLTENGRLYTNIQMADDSPTYANSLHATRNASLQETNFWMCETPNYNEYVRDNNPDGLFSDQSLMLSNAESDEDDVHAENSLRNSQILPGDGRFLCTFKANTPKTLNYIGSALNQQSCEKSLSTATGSSSQTVEQ